jgi:hypothetical protein
MDTMESHIDEVTAVAVQEDSATKTALVKVEPPATVAGHPLADLPTYVQQCKEMDGETVGLYFEQNWKHMTGNVYGMAYLAKEMKRKFSLLDRKKQVDGTYKTIRGFTSFEKWFTHATGKSVRMAYYVLETEEQKHKRNSDRRANANKSATPAPVEAEMEEETPLPKLTQSLPTTPSARNADWTDNEYIKLCVQFVESTLRPLESDPQRFVRVAAAIAAEIVGEMENDHRSVITESESELAAVMQ